MLVGFYLKVLVHFLVTFAISLIFAQQWSRYKIPIS